MEFNNVFQLTMSDVYEPPARVRDESHLKSMEDYRAKYEESVSNPATFWGAIAKNFHWEQEPTEEKFLNYNFNVNEGPIKVEWMADGVTNICYNCLDRNLPKLADNVSGKITLLVRI